ncbi:CehA/McbA family metallohydrolase [Sphingomonas sp. R1]|uniref:CehA/McbA family metallohydrolase n=1 Tax=Sphingomonas sp. R1 TaxID=399176 RepID=UPI0022246357|nr:CehA/McbA family metallohydrolase [Sphingomonas sp. R1]UYY75911.1 CehA/McbA family metallohydrolase [Sphingomonas sp. R1]
MFRVAALALAVLLAPAASAQTNDKFVVASLTDGVWMKGDLHVHSRHSKDSTNHSVARIIADAERASFDFLLISDHDNHVNGDTAHNTWSDPEFRSDKLLLLYGAEWTTVRGHAVILSAKPYDEKKLFDIRDARDVAVQKVKDGLDVHLSANHPTNKDHFGYSYDMVDSLEVWNTVRWAPNKTNLMVWDDMLSSGRKIGARGGSDSHHGTVPGSTAPQALEATANNIGTPTTWVFAPGRTREAVIAAIGRGRASISANPYAPRVELTADVNGDGKADMMMGDNAKAPAGPVRFTVRLSGKREEGAYQVRIIKNADVFATLDLGADGSVGFTDTPDAMGRSYYRIEVEGPQTPYPGVDNFQKVAGPMVAISNPIFFNFDPNF